MESTVFQGPSSLPIRPSVDALLEQLSSAEAAAWVINNNNGQRGIHVKLSLLINNEIFAIRQRCLWSRQSCQGHDSRDNHGNRRAGLRGVLVKSIFAIQDGWQTLPQDQWPHSEQCNEGTGRSNGIAVRVQGNWIKNYSTLILFTNSIKPRVIRWNVQFVVRARWEIVVFVVINNDELHYLRVLKLETRSTLSVKLFMIYHLANQTISSKRIRALWQVAPALFKLGQILVNNEEISVQLRLPSKIPTTTKNHHCLKRL